MGSLYILHLGHLADALFQSDLYLKKIEKQYIAVGIVKMFIDRSAEHLQLLDLLIPCIQQDR